MVAILIIATISHWTFMNSGNDQDIKEPEEEKKRKKNTNKTGAKVSVDVII